MLIFNNGTKTFSLLHSLIFLLISPVVILQSFPVQDQNDPNPVPGPVSDPVQDQNDPDPVPGPVSDPVQDPNDPDPVPEPHPIL